MRYKIIITAIFLLIVATISVGTGKDKPPPTTCEQRLDSLRIEIDGLKKYSDKINRIFLINKMTDEIGGGFNEFDRFMIAAAIEQSAAEYDMDPFFVMAVIMVESGMRRGAVSDQNCIGLMQINPATARGVAKQNGWRNDGLHNPIYNIHIGVSYLNKLILKYHNVNLALTAYNRGEGAVQIGQPYPPYYAYKVLIVYSQLKKKYAGR
jgi:soluble lytic murein transglycosylase-like protein